MSAVPSNPVMAARPNRDRISVKSMRGAAGLKRFNKVGSPSRDPHGRMPRHHGTRVIASLLTLRPDGSRGQPLLLSPKVTASLRYGVLSWWPQRVHNTRPATTHDQFRDASDRPSVRAPCQHRGTNREVPDVVRSTTRLTLRNRPRPDYGSWDEMARRGSYFGMIFCNRSWCAYRGINPSARVHFVDAPEMRWQAGTGPLTREAG
jgi:hypothetical protein